MDINAEAEIARKASREAADQILLKLNLRPREDAFARRLGEDLAKHILEAYTEAISGSPSTSEVSLRPICVPAALAFALAASDELVKAAMRIFDFPQ